MRWSRRSARSPAAPWPCSRSRMGSAHVCLRSKAMASATHDWSLPTGANSPRFCSNSSARIPAMDASFFARLIVYAGMSLVASASASA